MMKKPRSTEKIDIPEHQVLTVRALCKTYFQGDTHIRAVDDCYLTVERGEFISIIGTSGSGKSTLLHMLGGLDTPTSGKIYLAGRDLYDMSDKELSAYRNKNIGFIFQSFHLLPVLTAKENILLPQKLAGGTRYPHYFDTLVEKLGLTDRIHHLPSELSGGQQQRVAAARALINKPAILFADEPTGNLDETSAKELISLLLSLRQELNQTLVMVTHDKTIAAMADKTYTMQNGILRKA
ncbi:MAG: ABC transporter ATP-binding protein [Clostridia bacterium]|nr:ABC transporter ATP-binding protein [Clostridia bacterium]